MAWPPAAARTKRSTRCASRITAAGASDDIDIDLPGFTPPIVPVEATPPPTVSQLEYDSNTGRFTAALTVTGEGMNPIDTRISGRVDEMVEAPVALTRLLPDTVLRPDDVRIARVRAATLQNEVARSVDQIIGMQLRRPVAAGQPLRLADLSRPPLVQRGATVQIELSAAGLSRHRPGGGVGCRCRGRENPRAEPDLPCVPVCRGRWARTGAGHTRMRRRRCQTAPARFDRRLDAMRTLDARRGWLIAVSLTGCGTLDRLSEVGRDPKMTPTADPTKDPKWRPVSMPMPAGQPSPNEANSLWRSGSRAFFKDQRAAQVGDIVTVLVNMNDAANLKNVTSAARTSAETGGHAELLRPGERCCRKRSIPSTLVTASSSEQQHRHRPDPAQRGGDAAAGRRRHPGAAQRQSRRGRSQEFLVNSELRELQVTGVIRPQDIASDNTVLHDRMAEARIAYGGKGQLTDLQRARWGQQMLDILAPF